MSVIIIISILAIIYYLIKLYYCNKITSTVFITFFTILLLYRDLIISTINNLPNLYEFYGKYKNTNEIFNKMDFNNNEIEEAIFNKNSKVKPKLNYNNIEYKNVSFRYRKNNKYVLNNFNLKLNTENKIVGILGNSGNGKSTFAKLLIKLYKYDGEICIDGINIKNIDTTFLRKNIIFVNQNSKLFDKKIIENILYGCHNEDVCYEQLSYVMKYKKIISVFEDIDIYNKKAGSAGENVSGGQRQIVNIINGLITPSNITILDEPTNGLDGELKDNIIEIIKYFKKFKKCIIIITHDKDIKSIFDETINI
jgi:ABC-type bacteriocin/lantibiotic exporter with double-glycine peptidase domain